MNEQDIHIVADYADALPLTLDEVCEICGINKQSIREIVQYEIAHPLSNETEWQFSLTELARIKKALRLRRDLEVNLAGAAVVLDLLDELQQLREQVALLEKHFTR